MRDPQTPGTTGLPALRIGPHLIEPPLILAPMAGITDYPFRSLCRRWGAGLAVSEMVASQAMVRRNARTLRMVDTAPLERPLAVQLAGSDPEVMAQAARICHELGAEIIDINMGCPQRKIVKTGAGAALMRTPSLAARIVEAVRRALPPEVPVTVKMRLGWDWDHLNAPLLASLVEQAGAAAVTLHARTRSQMFGGRAAWELAAEVTQRVSIPLVINGDISDIPSLEQALRASGAQGAMVGRAALGRPWIFAGLRAWLMGEPIPPEPSPREAAETALAHCQEIVAFYGEPQGIWLARKHLAWYSKGRRGGAAFRREVFRARSLEELEGLVQGLFAP